MFRGSPLSLLVKDLDYQYPKREMCFFIGLQSNINTFCWRNIKIVVTVGALCKYPKSKYTDYPQLQWEMWQDIPEILIWNQYFGFYSSLSVTFA